MSSPRIGSSRPTWLSVVAETTSHVSSRVRYTLRGTPFATRLPVRWGGGVAARRRRDRTGEQLQHGLEHAHVDVLTRAAARVAVVARGQRAHHADDRGERVAERDRRQHRRTVGLAGEVGETAERLRERAVAVATRVRTRRAVTAHAHDDRVRVDRLQLLRRRSPMLRACGAAGSRPRRRRSR